MITLTEIQKYNPKVKLKTFLRTAVNNNYKVFKKTGKGNRPLQYFVDTDNPKKFAQQVEKYLEERSKINFHSKFNNQKVIDGINEKIKNQGFLSLTMIMDNFAIGRTTALHFTDFLGWESKSLKVSFYPAPMKIFKGTIEEAKLKFKDFLSEVLGITEEFNIINKNDKQWISIAQLLKSCKAGREKINATAEDLGWERAITHYSQRLEFYFKVSLAQAKKAIENHTFKVKMDDLCELNNDELAEYSDDLHCQTELNFNNQSEEQSECDDIEDPNYIWEYKNINLAYKYEFIGISETDIMSKSELSNEIFYFKPKDGGDEVGFKAKLFSDKNRADVARHFELDND